MTRSPQTVAMQSDGLGRDCDKLQGTAVCLHMSKLQGPPGETVGEGRNKHSSLQKNKARGKKPSRHPRLARLALQHSKLASPVKEKERKSDGPGLGIANRPPPSSPSFFFSFPLAPRNNLHVVSFHAGPRARKRGWEGRTCSKARYEMLQVRHVHQFSSFPQDTEMRE